MTKLIAVLLLLAVLYGGWELFFYWEKVQHEEETQKKQSASAVVAGEQLLGMPQELEESLRSAEAQGALGLKNWLKLHGRAIQDPRKAWIELDYCLLISRSDPSEAKRVFAEIKSRTSESSPVWPRIKKLEGAYQ